MKALSWMGAVLLSAVVVGCGDDSGSSSGGGGGGGGTGGGTGSTTTSGGGLTCSTDEVGLSGTIDGTNVDGSRAKTGQGIDQVSDPKSLTLRFTGGSATFEWTDGYLEPGDTKSTSGTLSLDGATVCFGSGSLSFASGGRVDFSMGDLSTSTDGTCPGAAVAGSVEGCGFYD